MYTLPSHLLVLPARLFCKSNSIIQFTIITVYVNKIPSNNIYSRYIINQIKRTGKDLKLGNNQTLRGEKSG